jgi:hypothetical protein
MATWQSHRCKIHQSGKRPQPTREQFARKLARADEDRMCRPCPPRPIEHAPGEPILEIELRHAGGGTSLGIVTLHATATRSGRRQRVDSYEVRSPWGDILAARGGLHAACRAAISHVWPRQLTREAYASMEA